MANIKLTLTRDGAEILRTFAKALPVAIENIQMSTEKLYSIYQSVVGNLGVHKQDFENLLSCIKKMQIKATYALAILVPNMNKTAEKIDEYVAFRSNAATQLNTRPSAYHSLSSFSRATPKTSAIHYLNNSSYTKNEVAQSLVIAPSDLSVAYSKDSNIVSKMYHELDNPIIHPKSGKVLKAVKGYYISNDGKLECVYAEYLDDDGNYYSYTKCMGDSVLSQMKKDELFKSQKNEDTINSINENFPWSRISHSHCYEFDLRMTNRNYSTGDRKWRRNCQRCVPTYEMRRRGYNVQAKPKPKSFPTRDHLAIYPYEVWENPNIQNTSGSGKKDIESAMKIWGDGARAQVVVYWAKYKGGHTFVATQMDGKTHFIDPQNENYDASNYFNDARLEQTTFCRIDNLEPSSLIKDCCEDIKKC